MLSAHGSAPEVVDGRPRPRPGGGRRGLPAGDQGPPRAQGPGPQGLHRPLRRPRTATRRRSAPWRWPPTSVRLVEREEDVDALDGLDAGRARRWRCWPRPPSATTSGPASWSAARERFPDLWMPEPQRPVLRHHQPPGRPEGHRRPRPTRSWSSARPTPPTPWPSRRWPRPSGCPRVVRVNDADELPDDLDRHRRGDRRGLGARGAGRTRWSTRLAPADGVERGRRHRPRTSTSRRPPSCASCSAASRRPSTLLDCGPRPADGAGSGRPRLAEDRATAAADVLERCPAASMPVTAADRRDDMTP